jgi:phage replication O-like protein O
MLINAIAHEVKQETSTEKKQLEKGKYMAFRNQVFEAKMELGKHVTYLEYVIVDVIIRQTIGWKQEEAKITIDHFCEKTGQQKNHVYVALTHLEKLGVITQRKHKHDLYFGLNTAYFGQLLIAREQQENDARRNKFKVVVDNTKDKSEIGTNLIRDSDQSSPDSGLTYSEYRTKNPDKSTESLDNLFCKPSIKPIDKTILKGATVPVAENGESFTPLGTGSKTLRRIPEIPKSKYSLEVQREWIVETNGSQPIEDWLKSGSSTRQPANMGA